MSRITPRQRRRAILAPLTALLLLLGINVPMQFANAEGGYVQDVSATCDTMSVTLSGYTDGFEQDKYNHVDILVDGEVERSTDFGDSVNDRFSLDGRTSHSWTVQVTAWDDPDGTNGGTVTLTGQTTACDSDADQDGVNDDVDNCVNVANPGQEDLDGDGRGDACDPDLDGDGVNNEDDAFPYDPTRWEQQGSRDSDGDKVNDDVDNCVNVANPGQEDLDGDGVGDACDSDRDGDGVDNDADAFPDDPSKWEEENLDPDGDGINEGSDNCPTVSNPEQEDLDGDGVGDACDSDRDGDGVDNDADAFPNDPTKWEEEDTTDPGDGDGDDSETPEDAAKNKPSYWEDVYSGSTCVKYDNVNSKTFTVPAAPDGTEYVSAIVKAGSRNSLDGADPNEVDETVKEGDVLSHSSGKNISHVILCYGEKDDEPVTPEGTSTYELNCEELVLKAPTGVKPADADYQYYLDGETIAAGSHELAPGEYTLVLKVNGKQVDSDTLVVKKCDDEPPTPTPATPAVSVTVDACVAPGGTTTASGVITNTDDKTDKAVDYDWSVTPKGGTTVVDSGSVKNVADGSKAPFGIEGLTPGAYTVTITGSDGTSASADFTVEKCDIPDPVFAPKASLSSVCEIVEGGVYTGWTYVNAVFDNKGSSVEVVFEVVETIDGQTEFYQIPVAAKETLTYPVFYSPEDGKLVELTINALDVEQATLSFNTEDCVMSTPPTPPTPPVPPTDVCPNLPGNQPVVPDGMVKDDGKCVDQPEKPGKPDEPKNPGTPNTPNTPNVPTNPTTGTPPTSYGVPETGVTLMGEQDRNGWPLMFGGLVMVAGAFLYRRRAIKATS